MHSIKTLLFSTLLLAATTTLSWGQGRFSLSATISPTWRKLDYTASLYTTYSSNNDQIGYNVLAKSNGGTVGLTAHYQFHPSWSVSSGLWYNRSTGYSDFQSLRNGQAEGYEPTTRWVLNSFQVPALINYSPTKHRLSPYLSAGMVFNMTYKTLSGPYFDRSVEPTVGHGGQVNTFAMVGLGVQYRFNSRLSLIVQPTALYQLKTLNPKSNSHAPSTRLNHFRNWQTGLQVQLKYTF